MNGRLTQVKLTPEQIQTMIKQGKLKILSGVPPVPTPPVATPPVLTPPSNPIINPAAPVHPNHPTPIVKGEEVAHWTDEHAKVLITKVIRKKAANQSQATNATFWKEVSEEVPGGFTPTQCRNKYFAVNKKRTAKKREAGTSGSKPVNFNVLEEWMEQEQHALLEPVEVPEENTVKVGSSLFLPDDSPTTSGAQTPVTTPYRKKKKRSHGSGTSKAQTRTDLKGAWLTYLKRSDDRLEQRSKIEERKMVLRERNLQYRKDKLEVEKERMKFERRKEEEKKARANKREELLRQLVELEDERVKALKLLKLESY